MKMKSIMNQFQVEDLTLRHTDSGSGEPELIARLHMVRRGRNPSAPHVSFDGSAPNLTLDQAQALRDWLDEAIAAATPPQPEITIEMAQRACAALRPEDAAEVKWRPIMEMTNDVVVAVQAYCGAHDPVDACEWLVETVMQVVPLGFNHNVTHNVTIDGTALVAWCNHETSLRVAEVARWLVNRAEVF